MIKTKKQMFIIIGVFTLVMMLGTVTYAFFNYTRTGLANTLRTGYINFLTTQSNTLELTNLFPVASNEVDATDYMTLRIEGSTNYAEGEEFEITIESVNNTINNKAIPINYIASYAPTASGEVIGNAATDYFSERGLTDTVYELTPTGVAENGKRVLVGYIPANGEIDGTLTINAYLDKDSVAISDTLVGTEEASAEYENGTTTNWVDGRTVLTTDEWNSLQNTETPLSFKIKAVSQEGIWVEEPIFLGAYGDIIKKVNTSHTIDFGEISSASNGEGLYILPGTSTDSYPIYYYRGAVTDNNVIFGGFCWQMVRTTETGGIKMVYNGIATDNGTTCTNSTHYTRIIRGMFSYDIYYSSNYSSIADVGYMNNTRYAVKSGTSTGAIYGRDIEWDGTNYLVIENTAHTASSNTEKDDDHHYSCGTSGVTSCNIVRYYYYDRYYINLTEGDLLEDAIYKMTGNGSTATKTKNAGYNLNVNNSMIKSEIDTWFRKNLTNEVDNTKTDYSVYLEDTVFCNDRSFKTVTGNASNPIYSQTGWNPSGGNLTQKEIFFGTTNRWDNSWYNMSNVPTVKNTGEIPNIACPNETDRFTVSSSIGNGALTYPVGLLTVDEIIMAGASGNNTATNDAYYLYTGNNNWTMSPGLFGGLAGVQAFVVELNNSLVFGVSNLNIGVRPVVSLKIGTEFKPGGEGTTTNPYVVKYN